MQRKGNKNRIQGRQRATDAEPIQLTIEEIIVAPEVFQIRDKINKEKVKEYKAAYRNETNMPPVLIANVKKVLYLVDGFHRIEALKELGQRYVDAFIFHTANIDNARFHGALENTKNGLPLKSAEKERIFDLYIQARKYRCVESGYKSIRQIARDLGFWSPNTVSSRLRKHYGAIYKHIISTYPASEEWRETLSSRKPDEHFRKKTPAEQAIETLTSVYKQIPVFSSKERGYLVAACKALEKALNAGDVESSNTWRFRCEIPESPIEPVEAEPAVEVEPFEVDMDVLDQLDF